MSRYRTVTVSAPIAFSQSVPFARTIATAVLAAPSNTMAAAIPATAILATIVLGQAGLPGDAGIAAVYCP
jgi:hypothetical protein